MLFFCIGKTRSMLWSLFSWHRVPCHVRFFSIVRPNRDIPARCASCVPSAPFHLPHKQFCRDSLCRFWENCGRSVSLLCLWSYTASHSTLSLTFPAVTSTPNTIPCLSQAVCASYANCRACVPFTNIPRSGSVLGCILPTGDVTGSEEFLR